MTLRVALKWIAGPVVVVALLVSLIFTLKINDQNASQATRLGRQNQTINKLASSLDALSAQLGRRGSVSQHVACVEQRFLAFVPAATSYLDAIGQKAPDVDQKRQAFLATVSAIEAANTECPALPS